MRRSCRNRSPHDATRRCWAEISSCGTPGIFARQRSDALRCARVGGRRGVAVPQRLEIAFGGRTGFVSSAMSESRSSRFFSSSRPKGRIDKESNSSRLRARIGVRTLTSPPTTSCQRTPVSSMSLAISSLCACRSSVRRCPPAWPRQLSAGSSMRTCRTDTSATTIGNR